MTTNTDLAKARVDALQKARDLKALWEKELEKGVMTTEVIPKSFEKLATLLKEMDTAIEVATKSAASARDVGGKKGVIGNLYRFLAGKSIDASNVPSAHLENIGKSLDSLVRLLQKTGEISKSIGTYTEDMQEQLNNHADLIDKQKKRVVAKQKQKQTIPDQKSA